MHTEDSENVQPTHLSLKYDKRVFLFIYLLLLLLFFIFFIFLRMIKEESVDVRGLGKSRSHFDIWTIALLFTYTNSAIAL